MNFTNLARKRSREDRLDLKHKGQLLCEWCNKFTPVDPTQFMMHELRFKDKLHWSEYSLKDWKLYKILYMKQFKHFYCDRRRCLEARQEWVDVAAPVTSYSGNNKKRKHRNRSQPKHVIVAMAHNK